MYGMGRFKPNLRRMLGGVVAAPLLFGLACVTATPTPTSVPGVTAGGKLTAMVGDFGNEGFDYAYAARAGAYLRIIHAFPFSSDMVGGRRVPSPGVVSNWSISNDGRTWILTVRKGLKFHDGTDLTVEDVLWSLLHNMGPETQNYRVSGANLGFSAIMERIEQTGADEIRVTTKTPSPELFASLSDATTPAGAVFPKREKVHDPKQEEAYDRNPIAAGPMRLVNHAQGTSMTFERFADYYHQPQYGLPTDKRVKFMTLELVLAPEEATRVAALRAGQVDIAPVSLGARGQIEAGGGRIAFSPEGAVMRVDWLGCWESRFPCHDRRVRHALAYAIDRNVMRDRLVGPDVMVIKGWFNVTPSTIGYSPELDPFSFDPAKARQMLADAGYPGGKGFGGLTILVRPSASVPFMAESAEVAADTWRRELGLDVTVRPMEGAAFAKLTQSTEDAFGSISWNASSARDDAAGVTRSNFGNLDPDKKDRQHNDPALRDVVLKALSVVDPTEREKALNGLYLRLRDEAYSTSLGYVNIPWGVGPRVRTWEPYPLAEYLWGLETITLK